MGVDNNNDNNDTNNNDFIIMYYYYYFAYHTASSVHVSVQILGIKILVVFA